MVAFLQEGRLIFSFSSTFCYPDCMSSIIKIKTFKHKISFPMLYGNIKNEISVARKKIEACYLQ